MKSLKKMFALVIAMVMVLGLALPAMADTTTPHTIEVTTNGNDVHEYSAFQIFVGNLDATGEKLSNVQWGSAITDNGAALIAAIKADTTTLYGTGKVFTDGDLTSAAKIAEALSGLTDNGEVAKAFADAVNSALGDAASTTKASTTATNKKATINVTGDGYYFVKDTGTIQNEDTATRFILQVVGNVAVNAKDTKLTPDKEIIKEDGADVTPTKDNDASIGDVITYSVTIPVPDTKLYKDHFVLHMIDTLEAGLTYYDGMKVTVDGTELTGSGTNSNYTTTVTTGSTAFTTPTSVTNAVKTTGGQTIKVVFNNFKSLVEGDHNTTTDGVQDWIGKDIVITYNVVLNKDATFGADSNDNTVHFEYSNNPNYDYDGDEFPNDTVKGKTPNDQTKTFVTKLELDKVDGSDTTRALAGAEFRLTGTSWNNVLATGEKFEETGYTKKDGETIQSGTYYKLKDGSYTTTTSTDLTAAQYEDGNKTYVKVTFAKVVREAKGVDLTLLTDENGHIIVEGIEQGDYTLQETKAPTGYNLDSTVHTLKIDWTNPDATGTTQAIKDAGGFSKGTGSDTAFEMDTNGGRFHITIANNSGSTLPSTGGIGTTIFYVIGGVLVLAAGIVLVTRKRMSSN